MVDYSTLMEITIIFLFYKWNYIIYIIYIWNIKAVLIILLSNL